MSTSASLPNDVHEKRTGNTTVGKKNPLEGLRVVVGVKERIKGELPLRVVVLGKVKEDGGGLKDLKVATVRVNNSWAVRLCEIRWR
jgi:hypothetical protein